MSFKSMCLYMSEPCMRWRSSSTAFLRARVSMSLGTQAVVSQGMLEAFVVAAEMWEHGTLQGGFQGFLQAWEAGVLCVCMCVCARVSSASVATLLGGQVGLVIGMHAFVQREG